MPKLIGYIYTVTNEGQSWWQFPIDMMRYDRATPYTEMDSSEVMLSNSVEIRKDRRLENRPFMIQMLGDRKPTEGRWNSFGWIVVPDSIKPIYR